MKKDDKKKSSREKDRQSRKDLDDEDSKVQDESTYSKYRIGDIDFMSESSSEDIDAKMNRMIEIKRKEEEKKDDASPEQSKLQKMKDNANKFQQQKDNKLQQKKEERINKLKTGLVQFEKSFPKLLRKLIFKKIKTRIQKKKVIQNGLSLFENFVSKKKNSLKKKHFTTFLTYSKENAKKRKEMKEKKMLQDKLKKEKEEKARKAEESKNDSKTKVEESKQQNGDIPTPPPIRDQKVPPPHGKKDNSLSLADKLSKVQSKKKRLELLQKKEEGYLKLVDLETQRRRDEVNYIEEQIKKQTNKTKGARKGDKISETESVGGGHIYNPETRIQNGLAFLEFFFINYLILLKLDFFQNICRKIGFIFRDKKYTEEIAQHQLQEQENERKAAELEKKGDLKRIRTKKPKKHFEEEKKQELKEGVDGVAENEREDDYSYAGEEDSQNDDTFIQLERDGDLKKPIDKSQLVEYDLFYKEQFFKNEVFYYDVDNIQDKEEKEINREMNKLDVKRRLTEKKKLKEVNDLKGMDTTELQEEIEDLEKEYEQAKKIEEPKVNLIMNNTEGLLYKGRLLGCYFHGKGEGDFPRFALEGEKEIGAKEVIDFKVLRKEELARRYFDYCCCLEERKKINKWLVYTRFWCRFFVDNWIFDNISLGVIIGNTILILISDPTDSNNLGNKTDSYFLYFYTVEGAFKIIAFTFISAEDAYIKDYWNILDFFVVFVGWISFVLERAMNGTKITGLAGLRAFRILRPLKTVKRFKGLKKLVTALLASIAHLGETTIVLIFFFLIFAIAGRQMWMGMFYRRCMNVNYGFLVSTQKDTGMCSFDSNCVDFESYGQKYICAKGYRNPDGGAITFDNTLTGFVTIFVMVTLEGWTSVFNYVSKTFKDKIYVNPIIVFGYFHLFVFLGAFYLINLFLAVTNSEFEHIETARKLLAEKKSFFKLIQSKYDLKEKEKEDKKEKQKKMKDTNNKKSDEALRELYYKVKDEAFHINRNRRNIPVLYSTVKDMYIMTNNNPEELYLQANRIEEEEDLLCKDIKRQQREIDILIDEKVKEMKKTSKEKTEEKEENADLSKNKTLTRDKTKNTLTQKKTYISYNSFKINHMTEELTEELEKIIKRINPELIELSIDNTQKFIKEQMIQLTKVNKANNNAQEEKDRDALRKKIEKKEMKKQEENEITIAEDLDFEKEKREKLKKTEDGKTQREGASEDEKDKDKDKDKTKSNINANLDKSMDGNNKDNESNKERGPELITDALSFMTDLSLSNLNESFEKENEDKLKYKRTYQDNDTLKKKNTVNDKLIDRSEKESHNNNNINDLINETERSLLSQESILTEKNIILNQEENIEAKVNFSKPKSNINEILRIQKENEIDSKFTKMREKFDLNHFLKKEGVKNTKVNTIGRRKSFLQFLQYTQRPQGIEDCVEEEKKENSNSNTANNLISSEANNNNNMLEILNKVNEENKGNVSMLSHDSHLTIDQNLSLADINLLPSEIREYNVNPVNTFALEDINKNLEANKIITMIRNSVFDRASVNTNLDLTSKEQSRYLRKMNNRLNRNLFCDLKEPRGRKCDDLDRSHIMIEREYENILRPNELEELAAKNDEEQQDISNLDINANNKENKEENNLASKTIKSRKTEHINVNNIAAIKTKEEGKNNDDNEDNNANNNENKIAGGVNNQTINNKDKKKKGFYIFKAKSIEKNSEKYPKENSNEFLVKEENKAYTDPLTVKQESIPDNLRGKKYYMNYLFNIADKDLKVKDTFQVDHWASEILGKKEKFIKKKPLPETKEAFFVFNDKKLNLKKYRYIYHKDFEYQDEECAYLTHNLKYLPLPVLEIMPLRLRNYGKYAVGKEIRIGTLGTKPTLLNISNINKSQVCSTNTRSGKTFSTNTRNSTSFLMSSAFSTHNKNQEDLKFKKGLHERVYKKIDEFNYKTLAHYFTEEEKLYSKFIDEKKRQEKIKELEQTNRQKQNRLEVKSEITSIQIFDLKTNSHRYVLWSGSDVLSNQDEDENRKKWNNIISALEDFNMIIWHENPAVQRMQKVRYAFYLLAINDYFDYTVLAIVIINSVFMALDGNILKPEIVTGLNYANYGFNGIFMFEYVVKFIGLSPLVYYSDAFTYLDTIIIAFAILDMATPTDTNDDDTVGAKKSVSSQLSFLRVFRIFRVIRLTKILRRLKSMRLIIVSMKKALVSVSYIVCILIMFILIFELLGMSLLSGNIHYQSFGEGFYTTYQVLTLENWNSLLYDIWAMNELCFFYFVVWIFLGNYIIFNLFTSVLLQSFGQENEEEDEDDLNEDEIIERMYVLPDYLNNIKKAEKEHKEMAKTQKKSSNHQDLDSSMNDVTNAEKTETVLSQSREITKSALSNSAINSSSFGGTSMMESQIDDKDDDNDDDNDNTKVYTGIDKNIKEWAKINKLFRKNECENAFYVLSQTNKFRIQCMRLINNKWFDRIILIAILASTARLIADTFLAGYTFVLLFDVLDAVFNLIFLLEAVVKICALGFALDEGSYLRDNWNKIDIIIVICSIFDFENLIEKYIVGNQSSSSLQFLKVLRLLRTLRPLRFISHNVQLKLIITSLFDSILPICNALFIVIVVYYMFSIVGISLFYESLHNCYVMGDNGSFDLAISSFENNLADYEINNDMTAISSFCASKYNGIMDTGPSFKFSNIINSFITSYVLSTQEGWPDIMNSYRIYGDVYGIFFIVYNLVVAYFFLNLFTGIMFKYFNAAFSKEQKLAEDDKKAPKYYDFLTQIYLADSHYVVWNRPSKGNWRYYIREFADSNFLDNMIMGAIFLNMVSMAMNYDGCHPVYDQSLTIANYIFTGIFIGECVLKLFAYGVLGYFHSGWNKFDFFVVVSSIVDLIVANIDGIDAAFLKSFQIIRVLRVLRVTRVLRLVKALKGLEKLIQTLTWSLKALANVLLLMIIIFSIFAILGCYFYDTIMYENYKDKFTVINENYNVDNFYNSFLLVFRSSTGENWPNIMMELAFVDTDVAPEAYAYIFMIISNFITSIILLNLFLMVTLQQYDEFTNKNYNPIEKFDGFLNEFNNAWNKYSTSEDKGYRIKKVLVANFFMDFSWKKLNFPEQGKLEYIKKYVSELKLREDKDGNVYYLDVICKVIMKQMGSQVDRTNPDNALILRTEKKVQDEIKKIIDKYIMDNYKLKEKKNLVITFNPLTSHLYFKISYLYIKTFINYYKENSELLHHLDEEQNAGSELDEEEENAKNNENQSNKDISGLIKDENGGSKDEPVDANNN